MTTVADADLTTWNRYATSPRLRGSDPFSLITSSITQYGITWTFSAPVEHGQFVTGDYYIIDSGSGVTVSAISPTPSGGANGSMKNPVPAAGQGFSSTAADYEASLLITLPLALVSGDSLLSSISRDGSDTHDWANRAGVSNAALRTVAVLTVLSSHPVTGTFRPSYSDRSHTLYNTSQIDTSVLANKSMTGITTPSHAGFGTVEYFERGMERPWILFGNDWTARAIHPLQNMYDYHQPMGEFLSEASLLLMTDTSGLTDLLHRYIQVGIDYRYNTTDASTWAWPVVFTGLLLGDADLYNFWINNPAIRTARSHQKLYYSADVTPSIASSIIPVGETWVDWTSPEGKYVAFRKQAGQEHEHLHPSEWVCYDPDCKNEGYRGAIDVYPLIGMVLSSALADTELVADVNAMLAHSPLRDYSDRWMSNTFNVGIYAASGKTYVQEMQDSQPGESFNVSLYGSGGTAFIDDMWAGFR